MKIDREVVEQVAQLAQLDVIEADLGDTIDSLSRILDLVDEMQQIDTTGIEPMAHPIMADSRERSAGRQNGHQRHVPAPDAKGSQLPPAARDLAGKHDPLPGNLWQPAPVHDSFSRLVDHRQASGANGARRRIQTEYLLIRRTIRHAIKGTVNLSPAQHPCSCYRKV